MCCDGVAGIPQRQAIFCELVPQLWWVTEDTCIGCIRTGCQPVTGRHHSGLDTGHCRLLPHHWDWLSFVSRHTGQGCKREFCRKGEHRDDSPNQCDRAWAPLRRYTDIYIGTLRFHTHVCLLWLCGSETCFCSLQVRRSSGVLWKALDALAPGLNSFLEFSEFGVGMAKE